VYNGAITLQAEGVFIMTAYVISQPTILDEGKWRAYVQAVNPLIESHGGRVIARLSEVSVLDGEAATTPTTLIEFPDMEVLQAFRASEGFEAARKQCDGAATMKVWAFSSN
jgi:uncharacterized protein (DUF1330 family)